MSVRAAAPSAEGVSERPDSARTGRRAAALPPLAHGPATDPAPSAVAPARRRGRPRRLQAEAPEIRVETPSRNGAYAGPAPVRALPRGVSGEQLLAEARARLVPGAIWQRAIQSEGDSAHRVRIEKVRGTIVTFLELDHARRRQHVQMHRFLHDSRPA